jgi:hypothetical protein
VKSRHRRLVSATQSAALDTNRRTDRVSGSSDERISALGALYQGEKADAAGIFNVAMALLGIGVAYLVGAIGASDKYGTGALPWPVVLLLPLPVWLIAIFNSLMTLNSMSHGVSVLIVEDALFVESRLRCDLRDFVGSWSADRIMDIRESKWVHKIATVVVYGGIGASVLLYTRWVIAEAWGHVARWMQATAVIGYTFAGVLVIVSWLTGLALLGKGAKLRREQKPECRAPKKCEAGNACLRAWKEPPLTEG